MMEDGIAVTRIHSQLLKCLLRKAAMEGGLCLWYTTQRWSERVENAARGMVFLAAFARIDGFGREIAV